MQAVQHLKPRWPSAHLLPVPVQWWSWAAALKLSTKKYSSHSACLYSPPWVFKLGRRNVPTSNPPNSPNSQLYLDPENVKLKVPGLPGSVRDWADHQPAQDIQTVWCVCKAWNSHQSNVCINISNKDFLKHKKNEDRLNQEQINICFWLLKPSSSSTGKLYSLYHTPFDMTIPENKSLTSGPV